MSKKVKKKNENEQVIAGFLKPTVASQRRSHKYSFCSASTLKNNQSKKKNEKKKTKSFAESLKIKKINGDFPKSNPNSIQSAVEMYSEEPHKQNSNCYPHLCEARKMCEELKEQIDNLKLQQSKYEEHMKKSNCVEFIDFAPDHLNQGDYLDTCTDENLIPKNLKNSPIQPVNFLSTLPEKLKASQKVAPFQDSSNKANQISLSNSFFYDPNTSDSLIKKLQSERNCYKRRVIKLQQELKMIKKSKSTIMRSPEIPLNELTFFTADMIGEGRSAVVYEGTLSGKPVAVKKLIQSGVMNSSDRSYLAAEAGLLLPLQHRNIVALIGICSSPLEPLIVTEFVNGKTLAHMLLKSNGSLDSSLFFSVARDTAIGMAYLHSQKPPVLHLNLRPSNILVNSFLKAKVADFGFSKIRIDAGVSNGSNLAYLAPELLKFPAQITIKTDVYAFAIVLWEMSTGRDPLAKRTTSQVLDMMENNQRLRIKADLPFAVQKLISVCWDPSPAHRPNFKEIIIDFETMDLPDEWMLKLKEIGITRTDTSELCSTFQDTNSVTSSNTPPSQLDFEDAQNKKPKLVKLNGHVSSLPFENNRSKTDERPTTEQNSASNPTPISKLRFVPQDLQSEINTPEIVFQKSKLIPNQISCSSSCSHLANLNYPSSLPTALNKPSTYSRHAWCVEPFANPNPRCVDEPSPFDSKFRDFVSDACQAESTHKAHSAASCKSSILPLNSTTQKSKSLLSSENIQVHSVSTRTSSSNNSSSLNTAVQPVYYQSSNELRGPNVATQPLSYLRNTLFEKHNNGDHFCRESELDKSTVVLDNAKRLLSCSPLQKKHGSSSTSQGVFVSSFPLAKPLPEYVPHRSDHRCPTRERGYLPSESSKSDVSAESFLPLPTKLINQQCLLSRSDSSKSQPGTSCSPGDPVSPFETKAIASTLKNQGQVSSDVDETKSDKVTRILTRTAEELNNASFMLYSASEEFRKQKLGGSL